MKEAGTIENLEPAERADDLAYEYALVYDPGARQDRPYYVALFVNGQEKPEGATRAYYATEQDGVEALDRKVREIRSEAERRKQRRIVKSIRV